jgi:hypothetical protein
VDASRRRELLRLLTARPNRNREQTTRSSSLQHEYADRRNGRWAAPVFRNVPRASGPATMPGVDGELGFQGGATFYQDGKVAVDVRRYFATDAQGVANQWWGKYEVFGEGTLASGDAYGRFSDGSEGEIVIEALTSEKGGSSFRIRSRTRLIRHSTEAKSPRDCSPACASVRECRLSRVGGNLQSSDASSKRAITPSSPSSGTGRSGWRVATQATPRSG